MVHPVENRRQHRPPHSSTQLTALGSFVSLLCVSLSPTYAQRSHDAALQAPRISRLQYGGLVRQLQLRVQERPE